MVVHSGHDVKVLWPSAFHVMRANMLNRRQLCATAIGTTGLVNATQHGHTTRKIKKFNSDAEPKRIRKSFYDLTDGELRNLCRAVGYMRHELKLDNPIQWDNYAKIHALHCTEVSDDHPAVHWSWHFLPWHRGYLYFLERILANILSTKFKLDGDQFALPYWDWISHKTMPNTRIREKAGLASPLFGYDLLLENMVSEDGLGFDNTALYDGNRGPSVHRPHMDPDLELTQDSRDHIKEAVEYMSPQYVSMMLAAPFEQFGGREAVDKNTGQGLLEQGPHNDGHDWVGTRIGKNRTMGTLRTAAADPIFYMHHANIDRIWSLYTLPQPDPHGPYGDMKYHFYDTDGSILEVSVREIITTLGNISYAPSLIMPKPPLMVGGVKDWTIFKVALTVSDRPITIDIPESMFAHKMTLLEVITDTINYTGRFVMKMSSGNRFIGRINFMDGYHRASYKANMNHAFNLIVAKGQEDMKSITFSPPRNSKVAINIKELRYRPL